jgi:hypothetical protein
MRLLIEAISTSNWKFREGINSFNDGGDSNNNNNYRGRKKTILTDIRFYPEVQWEGNWRRKAICTVQSGKHMAVR